MKPGSFITATRQIGIDMGHRVTNHGSKCRNVHGHRYTIEATIGGDLVTSGEQEGMVLDFGFLKEEMMKEIDTPCDHGMTLWVKDPLLALFVRPDTIESIKDDIARKGYCGVISQIGKLYVIADVPTAENLARHWGERLERRVKERTEGRARVVQVRVWETPNCFTDYIA